MDFERRLLPIALATLIAGGFLAPSAFCGSLSLPSVDDWRSPTPSEVHPVRPTLRPNKSYYVESRSSGTSHEGEPPRYVRRFRDMELFGDPGPGWLDFGADYRIRYEYRNKDLRRPIQVLDEPFLQRARVYLGVRDVFDPFRGAVEIGDSRIFNSRFPDNTRDVNELDIIQLFGELYFRDALGDGRPLRLQYGRMTLDYLDRRLIARNRWRNTTNTFQGFRAVVGQRENDWQVDLLAVQPEERFTSLSDRPERGKWFYAVIGDWRRWSQFITLQPYYLRLDQEPLGDRFDREIHTLGVRGYGVFAESGWDYDYQGILQFGHDGPREHLASAFTAEMGRSFDAQSKPRLSAFFGYASGDRDQNDGANERFDRLFGFARPWSVSDYITFENVLAPKVRLEFRPRVQVRAEIGYGVFWLASATDAWRNVEVRDPSGRSGTLMGHEIDVRVQFPIPDRTDVSFGYAHFFPGEFARNSGKNDASDFFFIQLARDHLNNRNWLELRGNAK